MFGPIRRTERRRLHAAAAREVGPFVSGILVKLTKSYVTCWFGAGIAGLWHGQAAEEAYTVLEVRSNGVWRMRMDV